MTFDAALARVTAQEFVSRILVERLAVSGVVVGYNFHFGKERTGSPDFLAAQGQRHGFVVDIAPAVHASRPAGLVRPDPRGLDRPAMSPRRRTCSAIPGS